MIRGDTREGSGGGSSPGDSPAVDVESLQAQLALITERLERLELSTDLPSVKNDIVEQKDGGSA